MMLNGLDQISLATEKLLKLRDDADDLETAIVDALADQIGEWLHYLTEPNADLRSTYVQELTRAYGLPAREDLRDLDWRIEDIDLGHGWYLENGTFPFGGRGLYMPLEWVTNRSAWVTADQAEANARITAERNRLINELAEDERVLQAARQRVATTREQLAALEG